MVIARPGPGLPVVLAGSVAAFAILLFPPSAQATLRRDPGMRVFSWTADRESVGLQRALQIALGAVWLLDAALQYQPYMFTRGFPDMLAMAATGQPGIVAGPVTLTAQAVSANPAAWNAAFATIQLALAVGLLFRATARAALAGVVVWALSVWWLGEGLGGVFTTAASPLAGAPGAAVLYALLAVLAWPGGRGRGGRVHRRLRGGRGRCPGPRAHEARTGRRGRRHLGDGGAVRRHFQRPGHRPQHRAAAHPHRRRVLAAAGSRSASGAGRARSGKGP
jgi:hypothetical protein